MCCSWVLPWYFLLLKFYGQDWQIELKNCSCRYLYVNVIAAQKNCKSCSSWYPRSLVFEVITWNFPFQVNNNCATGSSALYLAKQLVEGGKQLMLSEGHCSLLFAYLSEVPTTSQMQLHNRIPAALCRHHKWCHMVSWTFVNIVCWALCCGQVDNLWCVHIV